MASQTKYADSAKQTVIDIKDYLNNATSRAYKKGSKATHQFEKYYPDLLESVVNFTTNKAAVAKDALKSVGDYTSQTASSFGKQVYRTERTLLKVGIVYAAYKYFFKDNDVIAVKSAELKKQIRSKPVQSTFIALGAGYLLGRLIR